jgi:hypothetical protein
MSGRKVSGNKINGPADGQHRTFWVLLIGDWYVSPSASSAPSASNPNQTSTTYLGTTTHHSTSTPYINIIHHTQHRMTNHLMTDTPPIVAYRAGLYKYWPVTVSYLLTITLSLISPFTIIALLICTPSQSTSRIDSDPLSILNYP